MGGSMVCFRRRMELEWKVVQASSGGGYSLGDRRTAADDHHTATLVGSLTNRHDSSKHWVPGHETLY